MHSYYKSRHTLLYTHVYSFKSSYKKHNIIFMIFVCVMNSDDVKISKQIRTLYYNTTQNNKYTWYTIGIQ